MEESSYYGKTDLTLTSKQFPLVLDLCIVKLKIIIVKSHGL